MIRVRAHVGARTVRSSRLAAVALCALLPACTAMPADGDAPPRQVRVGLILGAQSFIDDVMDRQGFLEQVDLRAERRLSMSPGALNLMIAERSVDIGFGGFTTMARARAEGKDVIVVYGAASPVSTIFVRAGSTLESIDDLRGRRIGIEGGPGSTTFAFLAVIARQWYGLDAFREIELVTAPGPALVELLDRGDIDAALLGLMQSVRARAGGRHRVLVDLREEYGARHGGRVPAHVTITTTEAFAAGHPDVVRDYLRAYQAALDYIRSHPDAGAAYAGSIGMDDPAERALLAEALSRSLLDRWDGDQIAVQYEYLRLVRDTIGDSLLEAVPDDLIRDEYRP